MAKGKLVLLGSGETAPAMTKVHRELLSELGEVRALNLDSPYGFQLNVSQMTQKLVDYFKNSLQTKLNTANFTNYAQTSPVSREIFRQKIKDSNYIFSGPGSPSYALAQWKPMNLEVDLFEVMERGGTVCFSSAAALTLGSFVAPIYEIYKAGSDIYWLEGLNLMIRFGLNCVIIPHFNNAEGGNYDTSASFLGRSRLEMLEMLLPGNTSTLGIDEHTAVIIDADSGTLKVAGLSNAHWRQNGEMLTIRSGESIDLSSLQSTITTKTFKNNESKLKNSESEIEKLVNRIPVASDEEIQALARLAYLATSEDTRSIDSNGIITSLIELRADLRAQGNFILSDKIRDLLISSNVEITDSKENSAWKIKLS